MRPAPTLVQHRWLVACALAATAIAAVPCLHAQTSTRDSAGIRITENRLRGEPPTAFVVAAKPTLDFGGEVGDTLAEIFGRLDAALRLPDGRIAVATSGRQIAFRLFDRTGKYIASLARPGPGPGELPPGRPILERFAGDTIGYLALRRILVFAPNGKWVRTEVYAPVGGTAMLGLLGANTVLSRREARDSMTLYHRVRRPVDGAQLDTGVQIAAIRRRGVTAFIPISTAIGNMTYAVARPFEVNEQLDKYRSGFIAGTGVTFEIGVHDSAGRLRQLVRRDADLAVSPRDIDEYRAAVITPMPEPGRPTVERWLASVTFPRVKSAYSGLRSDAAGRIWVEEYSARTTGSRRWSVFEANGTFLGVVDMPPDLRVMEIGRDFILGAWRDADGFEHIRLHPFGALAGGRRDDALQHRGVPVEKVLDPGQRLDELLLLGFHFHP